jgi:hypothetical protein
VIAISVVNAVDTGGVLVSVVVRNYAYVRGHRIRIHIPVGIGFHGGATRANQSEDCD